MRDLAAKASELILFGFLKDELTCLGGEVSHFAEQSAGLPVVGDPLVVELCLAWAEPTVDGLAIDLGGEVPVGTVQTWGVGPAGAVGFSAPVVAGREGARGDVADVG